MRRVVRSEHFCHLKNSGGVRCCNISPRNIVLEKLVGLNGSLKGARLSSARLHSNDSKLARSLSALNLVKSLCAALENSSKGIDCSRVRSRLYPAQIIILDATVLSSCVVEAVCQLVLPLPGVFTPFQQFGKATHSVLVLLRFH